jgi:hypothetical protein
MLRTLRRPAVLLPLALVIVAAVAVGLFLFQPWRLVTNVTVDEALPTPTGAPASPATGAIGDVAGSNPPPTGRVAAASSPTRKAPAPSPKPAAPNVLAAGSFISHEHGTTGDVRILELADGTRVLRLTGLDTSNGPDLKVWLTDAPVIDGTDGWFVFDDGAYVDLGSLKGNRGNQNYAIPAGVDLSEFGSVAIWCDRFNVSFGAAELRPA